MRSFSRSCLPRAARRGAERGSAINGLGKGGALSLVLIVQATLQRRCTVYGPCIFELELELIQTHIAQKPVLRVEVGARAFSWGDWLYHRGIYGQGPTIGFEYVALALCGTAAAMTSSDILTPHRES